MTQFVCTVTRRLHNALHVVPLALLVAFALVSQAGIGAARGATRNFGQPIVARSSRVFVTTIAGTGESTYADGPSDWARFALYSGYSGASGIAVDAGGVVYVADSLNNRIRKSTLDGYVSTIAGSTQFGFSDGTGFAARLLQPTGIAATRYGVLYFADSLNNRVRKISLDWSVSTLAGTGKTGYADGPGASAEFWLPAGVAVNAAGIVYVADSMNARIRKIAPDGAVSTLAGSGKTGYADGAAGSAQFNVPQGVAVDAAGIVYVADTGNNRIRKITTDGIVSTLAGSGEAGFADGAGTAAQFNLPQGVVVDPTGVVYVADTLNNRIRTITPDGMVSTLAGSGENGFADGSGPTARFDRPSGIALDVAGMVYIADAGNNSIRKIIPNAR